MTQEDSDAGGEQLQSRLSHGPDKSRQTKLLTHSSGKVKENYAGFQDSNGCFTSV